MCTCGRSIVRYDEIDREPETFVNLHRGERRLSATRRFPFWKTPPAMTTTGPISCRIPNENTWPLNCTAVGLREQCVASSPSAAMCTHWPEHECFLYRDKTGTPLSMGRLIFSQCSSPLLSRAICDTHILLGVCCATALPAKTLQLAVSESRPVNEGKLCVPEFTQHTP